MKITRLDDVHKILRHIWDAACAAAVSHAPRWTPPGYNRRQADLNEARAFASDVCTRLMKVSLALEQIWIEGHRALHEAQSTKFGEAAEWRRIGEEYVALADAGKRLVDQMRRRAAEGITHALT